ncbi:MAG: ketol-acid reductoisomerase [Candidatus Lokiarchaeota archaeon]|nr:ketol-acid reductoisomerase [Candidatus Lokiarchaeota archaeon]
MRGNRLVEIFRESDGNIALLKTKIIAIIGYGNQGRAQALNLRDSGLDIIIGNIDDDYKKLAIKDGFPVYEIKEAIIKSDISFLLIPDEVIRSVFREEIQNNLKPNSSLVFASGYTIGFKLISPPQNINIILIAPRMIGVGVRENFLNGQGFFSFVAIEQDYTGNAREILLALAKGIGTLKKGAILLSFKQEAELDLFNEQGFGPAFGRVLLSSIYTLIDAGYPPEAVLIEMYMSNEMAYTYKKMADIGLIKQVDFHSQTSQYGAISRGIRFRKLPLKNKMEQILKEIQDGDFTKEWENKITKLKFKLIKYFATKQKINSIEREVRKNLQLKLYDIYEEEPPTKEEMVKLQSISEELNLFRQYYE